MREVTIQLRGEADTVKLAQLMAARLPESCVVALDGPLGAGKTRLVRAFAAACGISELNVTSPTFTLWQTYQGQRTIHHLDAYRIADEDEFYQLGIEECFGAPAVTFVEWAERVIACLPAERVCVRLDVVDQDDRIATLGAASDAWFDELQAVAGAFEQTK